MYDLAPSYEGWCGLTTRHAVPSRPGSLLRRIDCRRGASHYGMPHIRRASPGAIIPRAGESSGRSSSTPPTPCSALLDPSPVVTLALIERKCCEQFAGKIATATAMLQSLRFTAGLQRAGIAPERLFDRRATLTPHPFPVLALTAKYAAS